MPKTFRYKVLLPKQNDGMEVFSFTASAADIQRFARIRAMHAGQRVEFHTVLFRQADSARDFVELMKANSNDNAKKTHN